MQALCLVEDQGLLVFVVDVSRLKLLLQRVELLLEALLLVFDLPLYCTGHEEDLLRVCI